MTTPRNRCSRTALSAADAADVRGGLGVVHRLVRRHRHQAAARRPGHRAGVPGRLPGRAGDAAARGSPRSTTTTPRPVMRHPGSRRRCWPRSAGPSAEPVEPSPETVAAVEAALRLLPSHGWTQRHVRPPRPVPAGAVPTGRGPVPAPRHPDRRRHHPHRRHRDHHAPRPATWTLSPGRRPGAVRAVRGRPVAAGAGPGARPRSAPARVADALDEADPVTSESPHLCRSTRPLDAEDPGGAGVAADQPMGCAAVPRTPP